MNNLNNMFENLNNEMLNTIELTDEELSNVAGGKNYKIGGDSGKSHVRTGPGLEYKSIGILHRGEEAKYLNKTSTDDRGVVWYKIEWNGRSAWVSSMYTVKVRY